MGNQRPARKKPRHTGRPWGRLRARVIAEETHCALCGKPVNKTLKFPHKRSPTVDLRVPLSLGGSQRDRTNLRLAHFDCNASRGNGTRNRRRRGFTTTRRW